jgi:hypothetical protein
MVEAQAASALLALWNDVDPALDAVYNDWHAREHVPERCTVPGILWGWRYRRADASPMPRYLTLYGLRDAAVLDSAPYLRLLREPTPASARMRPALQNLSRWVCRLRVLQGIEACARLCVHALDAASPEAAAVMHAQRARGSGLLVAERLPDANPLPWLQGGQERAVRGDMLVCRGDNSLVPGASLYERLTAP